MIESGGSIIATKKKTTKQAKRVEEEDRAPHGADGFAERGGLSRTSDGRLVVVGGDAAVVAGDARP